MCDYLRTFYFGNGHPGLKQQLANKSDEIDARDVSRILLGQPEGERADLRPRGAFRPVPRAGRAPGQHSRQDGRPTN